MYDTTFEEKEAVIILTSLKGVVKQKSYAAFNYKYYYPLYFAFMGHKRSIERREISMKIWYKKYMEEKENFIPYLYKEHPDKKHIWNTYFK